MNNTKSSHKCENSNVKIHKKKYFAFFNILYYRIKTKVNSFSNSNNIIKCYRICYVSIYVSILNLKKAISNKSYTFLNNKCLHYRNFSIYNKIESVL